MAKRANNKMLPPPNDDADVLDYVGEMGSGALPASNDGGIPADLAYYMTRDPGIPESVSLEPADKPASRSKKRRARKRKEQDARSVAEKLDSGGLTGDRSELFGKTVGEVGLTPGARAAQGLGENFIEPPPLGGQYAGTVGIGGKASPIRNPHELDEQFAGQLDKFSEGMGNTTALLELGPRLPDLAVGAYKRGRGLLSRLGQRAPQIVEEAAPMRGSTLVRGKAELPPARNDVARSGVEVEPPLETTNLSKTVISEPREVADTLPPPLGGEQNSIEQQLQQSIARLQNGESLSALNRAKVAPQRVNYGDQLGELDAILQSATPEQLVNPPVYGLPPMQRQQAVLNPPKGESFVPVRQARPRGNQVVDLEALAEKPLNTNVMPGDAQGTTFLTEEMATRPYSELRAGYANRRAAEYLDDIRSVQNEATADIQPPPMLDEAEYAEPTMNIGWAEDMPIDDVAAQPAPFDDVPPVLDDTANIDQAIADGRVNFLSDRERRKRFLRAAGAMGLTAGTGAAATAAIRKMGNVAGTQAAGREGGPRVTRPSPRAIQRR